MSRSRQFALLGATWAVCSLVGWTLGAPVLTSLVPGRPALSPMTALILIVAAGAIWALSRWRRLALRLAAAEALCGIGIIATHVAHALDRLWIPQAWWSSSLTGIAFVLSGTSTMLLATNHLVAGQVLAFIVLLLAALLGLGHVVPATDLYALLPGTGVAIPTVLAFGALSVSQLLSFHETGVSAALTSRNAVGRLGRRLLLTGVAVALMLAVAMVVALQRGVFDAVTAVFLLAWCSVSLLGATLWSLAVAVDRAELARAAAERDRNQMRHMVAAAVTHDLRSPLQSATLTGHLLERFMSDPAGIAALSRLQRSHRRIERLLRSLLDSMAIGAGQSLALNAACFRLDDLVREVISESGAVLSSRVDLEGSAEGWWDREALYRVVENLLLNAVKYGEAAAQIRCRVRAAANDRVAVAVENRGPEIPPVEWEAIFQPFARSESARASPHVGWGVGLAYARSVAQGHGGNVQVAASGPQGTVFELTLPLDSRAWLALPAEGRLRR